MDESINEFKAWLEARIEETKEKSTDQNKRAGIRTFHLGEKIAFELALQEFNLRFDEKEE